MSDADRILSPASCKAARDLLRLTPEELARLASVSAVTLRRFESGERHLSEYAAQQILAALKREGVEFVGASGDLKLR